MTQSEAIDKVENMPEAEFQIFFKSLPMRVQLLVQGGLVDWRETLAKWYLSKGNR